MAHQTRVRAAAGATSARDFADGRDQAKFERAGPVDHSRLAATGNRPAPMGPGGRDMDMRPLGTTGIAVSPIGLGTVKLGRNRGVKYPGGEGHALPTDAAAADLLRTAAD